MTIWKFPLKITDYQLVVMPECAQILSVQMQYGTLCLWALVNQDWPLKGTGNNHSWDRASCFGRTGLYRDSSNGRRFPSLAHFREAMNSMLPLPIDSIPCWCPSWDEIKDKAHMYRTARIRSSGQYVSLLNLSGLGEGYFSVQAIDDLNPSLYHTEELCDFCL